MKNMITRKTSAMLLFVMIASVLFPVIAFASAIFTNVSYNSSTGTVTGSVYVTQDVYDGLNDSNKIIIGVYGANGAEGAVEATYNPVGDGVAGHYYYNITSTVIDSTYGSSFSLRYYYTGGSSDPSATFSIGSGTVSTGPTGVLSPPAPTGPVTAGADGKVDAANLTDALKGDGTATVNITGDVAVLPASALKDGKSIEIVASGASYTLPVDTMNFDELAKSLGVDLADLNVSVKVVKLAGDAAKAVSDVVSTTGGKSLAGAFDFTVTAEGKGKTQEIKNFGTYVSRSITLDEALTDLKKAVGVLYNPVTGTFSFVPATFSTVDGKTIATLKRNSNSIYTVISLEAKSFADLAGHWAKADVETLATKLIVEGVSADKFEPKRNITRAEFAAIVIRSLGLQAAGTTSKFSDVPASAWYASSVATAVDAGIISGYTDGTFKPTANITRQELAAMVVRAMKYAGKEVTLTDAQVSTQLAAFTDAAKLGWAKKEVAVAVNAGIVQGQSTTQIGGTATATRAEAAAMVLRYLTKVEFIN